MPGVGRWQVDHCLWPDLEDPALAELIEAILRYEQEKILPCAGGWYDQSEAFLMAYDVWRREIAAYRREQTKVNHGKEGR